MWPFRKSAVRTIKQARERLEAVGWSPDAPVVYSQRGDITAVCAATSVAMVPRGNPRAWGFLENVMGGMIPVVNKQPGMTKAKMLGFFRRAEGLARIQRA